MDLREEPVKEAGRFEEDLNEAEERMDRMAKRASEDLTRAGFPVDANEIKDVASTVANDARKALSDPHLVGNVFHEVEGMVKDVTGVELPMPTPAQLKM